MSRKEFSIMRFVSSAIVVVMKMRRSGVGDRVMKIPGVPVESRFLTVRRKEDSEVGAMKMMMRDTGVGTTMIEITLSLPLCDLNSNTCVGVIE